MSKNYLHQILEAAMSKRSKGTKKENTEEKGASVPNKTYWHHSLKIVRLLLFRERRRAKKRLPKELNSSAEKEARISKTQNKLVNVFQKNNGGNHHIIWLLMPSKSYQKQLFNIATSYLTSRAKIKSKKIFDTICQTRGTNIKHSIKQFHSFREGQWSKNQNEMKTYSEQEVQT